MRQQAPVTPAPADPDRLGRPDFSAWLPLPALAAVDYARGHALFEARSDQRARITRWLHIRIAARPSARPLSVLAVGCGAGAVDTPVAERAARRPGSAPTTWTGVDPHGPSVAGFTAALTALGQPRLTVRAHACTFAELDSPHRYDVVTFVQSMYYVPDVHRALRAAIGLLAPGGELLVLHAPLGALNQLTAALAPQTGGHRQWWSGTVLAELGRLPVSVERADLVARVDLTGCGSDDPALLDFIVQAALPDDLRPVVVDALRRVALPGPGLLLPHPVTALAVRPG